MTIDRFLTLEEVSKESGYTPEGIEKLCKKHGIGVRDYDNEPKYKGMLLSDYVALFGWT